MKLNFYFEVNWTIFICLCEPCIVIGDEILPTHKFRGIVIVLLSSGLITRKETAHATISALRCAYLRKDVRVVPVMTNFSFPSVTALEVHFILFRKMRKIYGWILFLLVNATLTKHFRKWPRGFTNRCSHWGRDIRLPRPLPRWSLVRIFIIVKCYRKQNFGKRFFFHVWMLMYFKVFEVEGTRAELLHFAPFWRRRLVSLRVSILTCPVPRRIWQISCRVGSFIWARRICNANTKIYSLYNFFSHKI